MPGTHPVALTASQAAKEATTRTTSAAASALPRTAPSSPKVAKAIRPVAGAGATLPRGTGARRQAAPQQQQDATSHHVLGAGDGVPGALPG